MNLSVTKQRILDAAEYLFAYKGFHNTSLRAITGRAAVNLAAVNYHFGSKETLLEAVFSRRVTPLNEVRLERLDAVSSSARQNGLRPHVSDLVRAFVEPTLQYRESGAGAEDFISLVGRSFSDPEDTVRKIFLRLVNPVIRRFYESIQEALPDLPEDILRWRFYFAMGAFANSMLLCGRRAETELFNLSADTDTSEIVDMLVSFITAGMEAE